MTRLVPRHARKVPTLQPQKLETTTLSLIAFEPSLAHTGFGWVLIDLLRSFALTARIARGIYQYSTCVCPCCVIPPAMSVQHRKMLRRQARQPIVRPGQAAARRMFWINVVIPSSPRFPCMHPDLLL
jgi:hypothetical protein